jgi:aromatic ring-opening dioxygenase catalytic subunit (LigB family)
MGRIIEGYGVPHVLFDRTGVEEAADRIFSGLLEIRDRIREAAPDLIVIVSNDHFNNFNLALQVPFVIGIADEYIPLGDMGLPKTPFTGNRSFAEQFVRFAADAGFDLARAEEISPDHGVALPLTILNTGATFPIVPIYVNVGIDSPPTPERSWRLGQTLKEMVETTRPTAERVVVIAAGGLSHWLCVPEEGRVNEEFDRDFIAKLTGGRGRELAQMTSAEILEQAGNGGLEVTSWILMAGALPGAKGEQIFYEPLPQWITGMGGVALRAA